jgi:ArsR family metal-binding transcriptional regulator
MNKKTELHLVIKEKGQGNIQVKIINEEVDEAQTNIGSMRKRLEEENNKYNELASKRDMHVK